MVDDHETRSRRHAPSESHAGARPHPIFDRFEYPARFAEPGWYVDFLGVRTRIALFSPHDPPAESSTKRLVTTGPPDVNEEYFEWIAVLEAACEASDSFTMIELGAGWGRWLAIGALAVRQSSGVPVMLIGVESEPLHFKWLKRHLADNGIRQDERRLIRAAVAATDGHVWFQVGRAADWYGQSIAKGRVPSFGGAGLMRLGQVVRRRLARHDEPAPQIVPAVSLTTLLEDNARVDLIDVDIQGAEAEVLEPAAESLDSKVRRVHVGTHGREAEARLRTLFGSLGWQCTYDFPSGGASQTPWGLVPFEDGVQTWLNPGLQDHGARAHPSASR